MEEKQITIRFSDIFAALLKSICLILVLTILFTGLGGAFGIYRARHASVSGNYVSRINTLKKDIDTKHSDIRKIQNTNQSLIGMEIPYSERKVESDRILCENRRDYLENSILYNMDCFYCGTSRIVLALEPAVPETVGEEYARYKRDEIKRIVNACTKMAPLSDENLAEVMKLMGMENQEKRYVNELVVINNIEDEHVELLVYNNDLDAAKKAADFLYKKMESMIQSSYPNCTVSQVSATTGYEVSWALYDFQTLAEETLLAAERTYLGSQTSLEQMAVMVTDNNQIIADGEAELQTMKDELETLNKSYASAQESTDTKKSAVKFGILACVGGFILACLFVFLRDFLGSKVRNRTGVSTRYDFPILGVLPSETKNIFKKWIRKLEGDPTFADKDVTAAVAANALALASENDGKICLIGTAESKIPSFVELQKAFDGKLEYKGNILAGADGIKNIADYDKVILVEKRNESRYSSITDEIARIQALKKEIIGIILL